MAPFPFKEPRVESRIPVWLELVENATQNIHPGKMGATIVNISQKGACLRLSRIIMEGTHLFFATLDNCTHTLLLSPCEDGELNEEIRVAARSVWMDSFNNEDGTYFKVGICFIQKQKNLFKTIKALH